MAASILLVSDGIRDDETEARTTGGFGLGRSLWKITSHKDHLLRKIGRFVDLRLTRKHLTDSCSITGRPSIDVELLIRMLLVGNCFGMRFECGFCEEVHLSLAAGFAASNFQSMPRITRRSQRLGMAFLRK